MPPEQQTQNQATAALVTSTQQPQISQIEYAGFWVRFLAFCLDSLIVSITVTLPVGIITAYLGNSDTIDGLMGVLQMVLSYAYFIYFTNKDQATIGKRLLGLRVVSEDGSRLPLGRIAFRETIGKIISIIILFIGYLMIAFTSKKQGLHDLMVKSVVLSNRAERKTWAFVISIIIAVTIPVIMVMGILAAITLASLNTARAKGADASVKSYLSGIRAYAEISYDMNNNSYATICSDQDVAKSLEKIKGLVAQSNVVCNASDTSYAVYAPLKYPTLPATGWCVDSTGVSDSSPEIGARTTCSL